MDTTIYDMEIKNLETEITDIKEKMEKLYNRIVYGAGQFVSEWSKDEIEKYAKKEKINITKKIAKRGDLTKFKLECKKLIEKLPSIVKKKLDNSDYWIHKDPLDSLKENKIEYLNEYELKKNIKKTLRKPMGKSGKFLLDYDYYDKDSVSWGWEKSINGITYKYRVNLTDNLKKLIKNYICLQNQLYELVLELKTVEQEKSEAEIEELWNNH